MEKNSENNNSTRKFNTNKISQNGNNNGKKKTTKKVIDNEKKKKIMKILKISLITLVLLVIIGGGAGIGIFWAKYKDELTISKEDLVIPYQNSTVYDKDGELIATLSGGAKRKCISLSEMGEFLPKAYVAIEDERFYKHSGVDLKRTMAATVTYILHGGSSSFGGSTITQQLVKNITNDKEDSKLAGVIRKVKEISKAYQVEQYLSKDQILELYLNLIFMGGSDINGVELGAKYYFNKEPAELSLAECAFMAGINNSPNSYKPFSDDEAQKERINKRAKTVLVKMKELSYITEEQYNEGIDEINEGFKFEKSEEAITSEVSYLVEAALDQVIDQLMEEKNMSKSLAETYTYSGGLKIYTTQDTKVQKVLEEKIVQDKYWTEGTYKNKNDEKVKENSIPTMVILDHVHGYVVAAATATGNKGERIAKTRIGYLNYPISLRKQTGSSMKPIAVIAPGLESKTITASTVYLDEPTSFNNGKYNPKDYYPDYRGPLTMRQSIAISANIPHVKALADIGLETSIDFCESVGLPRFEQEGLSLALGGLSDGVTVTEMAGAYGAIANSGVYVEPTFYTKVTDNDDNIILEPNQTTAQVMSEQNAYIEKSILTSTVVGEGGTATYCAIKGMNTAAKTGTTNKDYDRWLCGFTPYYTATCWYGYQFNAKVSYSGNPAGKIWAEVMKEIHKELPNAEFVKPEGVVSATVCKVTGMSATEGCTETYVEYFTQDTIPEPCDGHQMLMTCTQTNLLCSEGCPFGAWYTYGGIPPRERNATWSTQEYTNAPTEYCPHNYGNPAPAPTPEVTPTTETPSTDNYSDEIQKRIEEEKRKLEEKEEEEKKKQQEQQNTPAVENTTPSTPTTENTVTDQPVNPTPTDPTPTSPENKIET